MDLYSAAKRMGRPFEFPDAGVGRPLQNVPIGHRGLIGDGQTAALVRADGVIDWLSFPRFDSPAVFGAMLDPARGGMTAVRPTKGFTSLQRYDPGTNVLETLFEVPGEGIVRLTDYMPWSDDPRSTLNEVHRRIQCVEGSVELEAVFDPRFDYGRDPAQLLASEHGVLAVSHGGERLVAALSGDTAWSGCATGGMHTTFKMAAGQRRWMILAWGAPRPEPIKAYRPDEHLRSTRSHWREWSRGLDYDGPWRHHVIRGGLLLKLLIYAPTGAMVAAPTTSLPEWIGGVRNWDYRFSWTRDSAMAIRAATLLKAMRESADFFHFVRDTLDGGRELEIMYTLDGDPVPEEFTLEHLRGFEGSAPVRIGNGARDQLQLDTAGALLDTAFVYENSGGSLTLRAWRNLRRVVDQVQMRWTEPDHGIWEPRDGKRHNVHSKLMSWVALRRGAELAPLFGDDHHAELWREAADQVHADVALRGLDPTGKHFVAAYQHTHADAALLLLPIHGFLPPDDPRVVRTVDFIKDQLGQGPYLHRYKTEDGVGGEEGAFVLCGFWLAEVLAMQGRIEEAQEVFLAHAEASNHLGLLAEEIDPDTGALLGNFPQAFSHLGLIQAAARIDLALRLRDEGSARVPVIFGRKR